MKWLAKFVKEDEVTTAVEYGVMIATLAAVIIGVVVLVGGRTNTTFDKIDTEMGKMPAP